MAVHALQHAVGRAPRWLAPVVVGVGAVAATAALGVLDPETRGHLFPGCPFRMATGLDCPGCGGTRAVIALTQGDVGRAFEHNALTMLLLPVLILAWAGWLWFRLGRRAQPPSLSPVAGYALAATFVVFWVIRNLPWMPFAWLGSGVA